MTKKHIEKVRAGRNRTLTCSPDEMGRYKKELLILDSCVEKDLIRNKIINQDVFTALSYIPDSLFDLLIVDPPYNLTKNFHGVGFSEKNSDEYRLWFETLIKLLKQKMKITASIYVCSDWKTSAIIQPVLSKFFQVHNRITWEREKGRGAKTNWKNNTEDIWFASLNDDYVFNVDAVKLKRKVIAPYKDELGTPKDWMEEKTGNYRLTFPSNIWSDITIPFWSMPENTDHPTQKPEKLIAKLVLASSNPHDLILDPFLGSGTTAVVCKKLGRNFCAVELNQEYCSWALKRLAKADDDKTIQGYSDGVFWERNTLNAQLNSKTSTDTETLF